VARKPKTAAEERLIKAAIEHMKPHKDYKDGLGNTITWACFDAKLSKAIAAVLRERGKK